MRDASRTPYVFGLATILLWASAYVGTRVAVRYYTPEAISFLRYLIASLVIVPYALRQGVRLPARRDVPLFFLAGAAGFSLYMYFFNLGSRSVSAAMSSFIVSACPVLTALLARCVLKEKIGLLGWVAVGISFFGVGVITLGRDGLALHPDVVWICVAALLISMYNIFQRSLLGRYTPLEVTTYAIVAGTLLLAVFAPQALPQLWAAPPLQFWNMVYMGVFPSSLAYLFWSYALSRARNTSQVANLMFLTPILTTFMGYFLIDEFPHPTTYAGGVLVLAGVLLVSLRPKR